MRIRDKFTGILGLVFLNVVLIVVMSLFAMSELQRYETSAERGAELIVRSRSIFNLMKDLSVTAFAPETYPRLKDVFYFEKFDTTLRDWAEAVGDFKVSFETFMGDPTIVQMAKADSLVGDEYNAANTMSHQAFGRLESLLVGFRKLQASGYLSQEDSYLRILSSPDVQVAGLFSEVRNTSYYLKNNFESFMNHFVKATNERVEVTRDMLTWSFLGVTLATITLSLSLSVVFGNRIIRHVGVLRAGMAKISRGDFTHHISVSSHDELGELADNINSLAGDLKTNIDHVLQVTRDIGSAIDAETDLAAIRRMILQTVGKETGATGAALLPRRGAVLGDTPPVTAGLLDGARELEELEALVGDQVPGEAQFHVFSGNGTAEVFSSLVVCPLPVPTGTHGRLVAVTDPGSEPFTDLDFVLLQSYADFASLSIDNYLKYRELIELREAEYQSLQARIQPHFLYNVLNGLIGLNRKADRNGLEAAVLDLKDLLRYTLDHGRTVALSDELGFVRRYLDLQKLRFGDRFEYRIACDPACESLPIPKLLLQPLAENALIHGIEIWNAPGFLDISAAPEGDGVRIVIRDNGAGFDLAAHDPASRVGLSNVTKRLELAYPSSSFHIASAPGRGCTVEMFLRVEGGRL